jgi:hypothetical protein
MKEYFLLRKDEFDRLRDLNPKSELTSKVYFEDLTFEQFRIDLSNITKFTRSNGSEKIR